MHLGTTPIPVCLDILKQMKHQAPNTALYFNSGMIMSSLIKAVNSRHEWSCISNLVW